MQKLVNFIVVGVQKAGTRALYDYLADDPAIAMSKDREVHFFDDETVDWSAPDYGQYHAQFDAVESVIWGEATPDYLYWPQSLDRIVAYNRDIRLIVMLRDPVERAWSHWRMEFSRGAETRPFSWCIREGRQRLFEAEPWGAHRVFSYVERGFYGEQIERLFSIIPRKQVLLLSTDALWGQPSTALTQVGGFLGVPTRGPLSRRYAPLVHDDGETLSANDVGYLRDLYKRDMSRLQALTGIGFW